MRRNNGAIGIPETFVHECYWLSTWRNMYSFKVDPINGRRMWIKSPCPTTLLPPKHRVPIGRPKKKRRKSATEKEDMIKGNTVSRAQKLLHVPNVTTKDTMPGLAKGSYQLLGRRREKRRMRKEKRRIKEKRMRKENRRRKEKRRIHCKLFYHVMLLFWLNYYVM
uniref:Uncharacterized protein n=1 Tax=Lactuca sativa TaxID=4236 RepID=A0A9R1VC79_LACSA|nr:hypothetical protein LSAT_V11C500268630 [Lactuca sativa]